MVWIIQGMRFGSTYRLYRSIGWYACVAFHSMPAGSLQYRWLRIRVHHGGTPISQKQKVMRDPVQEFRTRGRRRVLDRGLAARGVTRSRVDRRRNRLPLLGVRPQGHLSNLDGHRSRINRLVTLLSVYICYKSTVIAFISFACFRMRLS